MVLVMKQAMFASLHRQVKALHVQGFQNFLVDASGDFLDPSPTLKALFYGGPKPKYEPPKPWKMRVS